MSLGHAGSKAIAIALVLCVPSFGLEVYYTDQPDGGMANEVLSVVGEERLLYVYGVADVELVNDIALSITATPGELTDYTSVLIQGDWDETFEPAPDQEYDEIFNFGGSSNDGIVVDGMVAVAEIGYSVVSSGYVDMTLMPLSFTPPIAIVSEPRIRALNRGDVDLNGGIDFDDIAVFVSGLTDPVGYYDEHGIVIHRIGDMDGDRDNDFDDIEGFVSLLSTFHRIPEPASSLSFLVVMACFCCSYRPRRK